MTRPNDSYIKTCVIIHTVGELKDSTNGYHEWVYSNTAVRYTVARFSRNSSANLRKKKTNKSQTEVPSKLLGTSVWDVELTKPYTGQTADKNWESPLIQKAHLMSVPYIDILI